MVKCWMVKYWSNEGQTRGSAAHLAMARRKGRLLSETVPGSNSPSPRCTGAAGVGKDGQTRSE
jgi:hypothetical protein